MIKQHDPKLAFTTSRSQVFFIDTGMARALQTYLRANRARLAPFEPLRSDNYFSLEAIQQRIAQQLAEHEQQRGVALVVRLKSSEQIIATINFSNLIFGVFQACHLGFAIDQHHEGQGLMVEVLKAAIEFIRQDYGLHRIMANHLPDNVRSERLLNKLGFEREGFAKSYLKINGEWRDHVLTAYVFAD